ncbi:hypothetical protein ACHAWF_001551 [Thalassiosira exigua]
MTRDRNRGRSHRRNAAPLLRNLNAVVFHVLCTISLLSSTGGGINNEDNGNNPSQDYDDIVQENEWFADDPYMQMVDDYVREKLKTEMEIERESELNENEMRLFRRQQLMRNMLAGFLSTIGFASAIYCSSVMLYSLRVYILMHQYARDGVVVDGRILLSIPDIHETMKTAEKVQNENHDSYSMMTEEESGSGSGFSASDGTELNNIDEVHKLESIDDPEQRRRVIVIGSSPQPSTAKSRQAAGEKGIISKKQKFDSKSFRVFVEYDDVTNHDDINQSSSEMIYKRFVVMGEDIVESSKTLPNPVLELYVIRNHPMSGHPCGEVRRALRWQKILSFNIQMMFGIAFVVGGSLAAKKILPARLFAVYIGLLITLLPALNSFLNRSFSKIISDKYLESGSRRPSTVPKKNSGADYHEKMITALKHGTSFGFV